MSQNTIGKKHPNYNPSLAARKKSSDMLKKQRQDPIFNKKMFESLNSRIITKPHIIVRDLIKKYTSLDTISNYTFKFGSRFGSIDEADPERKIAVFIDGNYWHNFPIGRRWDKYCTTCLKNKGWRVYRFWESEIKKEQEKIISIIKELNQS